MEMVLAVWDGTVSNERNPTHYYANPGTYSITLSITGQSGSDSETKTIIINAAPPNPDFIAEPTTGSVPLTVTLSDVSTGDVAMRRWVIMKGPQNLILNRPGDKNEVYTFNEPGLYTVNMTVYDSNGKSIQRREPDTSMYCHSRSKKRVITSIFFYSDDYKNFHEFIPASAGSVIHVFWHCMLLRG